ncbi:unnamed protein product [Microthlaspi erraticum]|uniref:Retrotransposon gag domain-containing protein n=1 Tax=Microthlaspi erraticum TaxID=1685480 RepID=A0A6D2JHC4_9BRAS|nr:unnamed protein product [Microthlaspi erraticum]
MAEEEDSWDQLIDTDQSMSEEDASYMEDSWSEEGVDEGLDDYGKEPGREEPEPEPPDLVHCSSSQRRWYQEEEAAWGEQHHEEDDTREESWTVDDSSQGEYEQPRSCEELNTTQPYNALRTVLSRKRNYLEWERNLDEWLYYNHILKEQRLDYAVGQLKGSAYQWWLQEEDDRWFYKEPTISTWGELKALLRNKYAQGV